MLSPARPTPAPDTDPAPTWSPVEWFLQRYWLPFSRRWPIGALFVVIVISNVAGTVFNFVYNIQLIVAQYMDEAQKDAFWATANVYNSIAWPICLGLVYVLLLPVVRALREMRRGREPSPGRMEVCRQRLVNFTLIQMGINALGWVPGAIVFPLSIISLAGEHMAEEIWQHFAISFTVSALLTTVQTFFLCESYLIAVLYPAFFKDARPAQVQGAWRVPFSARLTIMWMAVALMPLIALLVVAQNFEEDRDHVALRRLATVVTLVGVGSGGIISYLVGRQLHRWIKAQAAATEQIALGRFDVRVPQKRPDEWGRLTDDFNDMAAALGRAQVMRETFGQIVGPRVRDSILERYQGVGGEVRDITVLFADIRGFTQRSAGESPDRVFALLNRVLTLAVAAVEKGDLGMVNKFLGDGFMALFGADRDRENHADLAVTVAVEFISRLETLNRELAGQGEAPLRMGVGIHSGPALVGCIGASLGYVGGREQLRREFTAIGETVNLAQRVEQLTKTCGGAILLSEETRGRLKRPVPVVDLGPQPVPGLKGEVRVYRVLTEEAARGEKAPA